MARWALGAVGLAILVGAGWTAATAQVQRVPGPGSGIVTVMGDINVSNRPTVDAAQQGDWKVSVANTVPVTVSNTPTVTVALPITPRKGSRYEIVWSTGERETVVVAQAGSAPWVRAERSGITGSRWVNMAAARSITELP